jgi:hypothetical protein
MPLLVPLSSSAPQPGRKPPSRAETTSSDFGIRICNVCGEKAGKHSYYGGQVCPSCRAFFRRSVQSKYSDVYTCSKVQNCAITLKTRKNCQYCRFHLCEKAGMKRSWVLADGDRKGGKKGSSSASESSSSVDDVRVREDEMDMPAIVLTADEQQAIRKFVDKMNAAQSQQEKGEELSPQVSRRNSFTLYVLKFPPFQRVTSLGGALLMLEPSGKPKLKPIGFCISRKPTDRRFFQWSVFCF